MNAFVHSSYVSKRVLAQADVRMFAERMVLVVQSTHGDFILTQKLNRSTNKQMARTRQFIFCASRCVCVCFFMLNIWCLLFHLALVKDSYACMLSCTRHTWVSVCLYKQMCVCFLNKCFLLFHLALMMDLCVFIHACLVHSAYMSERVLAPDVCMFAELMMFVVPSSPYDSILTLTLNRSMNKQTDHDY